MEMATLSIGRAPDGFGICSEDIPFDGLTCSKRVKFLRALQVDVARAHKNGDQAIAARLTREAYSLLRRTWERRIEEVLFAETVIRFSEGVYTKRLSAVEVSDDDYRAVENGMTKCSKFSGHDGAALANVPTPPPDDLQADIEAFETWRKDVVNRQKVVLERRKQ